jgi:cell division protein FtsN
MSQEINIEFVNDDKMPGEPNYASNESGNADPTIVNTEDNANNNEANNDQTNSGSGDFKVVAGVFKEKSNADKRLNILLDLGYDSKIISKSGSDTHTVVVGTYSSMESAQSIVETLKRENKIRSFVKR